MMVLSTKSCSSGEVLLAGWGNFGSLGGLRMAAALAAFAAAAPAQDVDLGQLSLKRLLDIDVTSVSKRSQRLHDVASSIYVITEEDIRRCGATRIVDVLKMAPGAWFADDSYTIGAMAVREGAHTFNQTLLWIVDGVTITNPVTGGLVTDVLDLPLSDIQRIEVIKGPGGTIYGANAASGIISIFTKGGEANDGVHASLDGGTQGYVSPYFSYGFEPHENFFLTAWGKYKLHDGYDRNPMFSGDSLMAPTKTGAVFKRANLFPVTDDDNQNAISFGAKWDFRPMGRWRWSGGINQSTVRSGKYLASHKPWPDSAQPEGAGYRHPPPSQIPSEDRRTQIIAQSRFDYSVGDKHSLFLNVYHWRHIFRWMAGPGFNNDFDMTNLEFQDNMEVLGRHRLSMGANIRRVYYHFTDLNGDRTLAFADPNRVAFLLGAFLQDDMALGQRLRLTMGAKAETWTLLSPVPEISPSLRLAYRATDGMTFWAAASRSITTPSLSQFDMEFRIQQVPSAWYFQAQGDTAIRAGAGKWVALISGGDVKPGVYYTLEAGHRGLLGSRLQWDLSGFYSWARDQVSLTPLDLTFKTAVPSMVVPGDSVVPLYNANLWQYEAFGGEALLRIIPTDYLRLEVSYAQYYKTNFEGLVIPGDPQGNRLSMDEIEQDPISTPRHVGRLKAYLDLPLELDLSLFGIVSSPYSRGAKFNYFIQRPDPFEGVEVNGRKTNFQLDLMLQRAFFRDRMRVSLWGRNLLAREPFVEYYNQYVWSSYPHQIHWTFGSGIEYRF